MGVLQEHFTADAGERRGACCGRGRMRGNCGEAVVKTVDLLLRATEEVIGRDLKSRAGL